MNSNDKLKILESKDSKSNPYQPDILIFLLSIPFISAVNYYLTYKNVQLNSWLLITYTIDTTQGYLAWWACRKFIFYLDAHWSYEKGKTLRIIVQFFGVFIIGIFLIVASTELISWIVKGRPAIPSFYAFDIIIISIWFFFINVTYVGLYYYNKLNLTHLNYQLKQRQLIDGILVRTGKLDIKVAYSEIESLYVDGEYAILIDSSKKKYYIDLSLDKLETNLPEQLFFRINRQCILHRNSILGFKRETNGKLTVTPKSNVEFPFDLTISRLKAPAFKRWFQHLN